MTYSYLSWLLGYITRSAINRSQEAQLSLT